MKFRIMVSDDGRSRNYGPFKSRNKAKSTLSKKGWHRHRTLRNKWGLGRRFTLSSRHASVMPFIEETLLPPEQLPAPNRS